MTTKVHLNVEYSTTVYIGTKTTEKEKETTAAVDVTTENVNEMETTQPKLEDFTIDHISTDSTGTIQANENKASSSQGKDQTWTTYTVPGDTYSSRSTIVDDGMTHSMVEDSSANNAAGTRKDNPHSSGANIYMFDSKKFIFLFLFVEMLCHG